MTRLGQLDAPQALQDLEGLKLMLHKVSNEPLRQQLAQGVERCRAMLQEAMTQDLDAGPGIDCVARLYEAFEDARRAPAASLPAQTQQQQQAPLISPTTMYWIAGVGALAIVFMSSVSGE